MRNEKTPKETKAKIKGEAYDFVQNSATRTLHKRKLL